MEIQNEQYQKYMKEMLEMAKRAHANHPADSGKRPAEEEKQAYLQFDRPLDDVENIAAQNEGESSTRGGMDSPGEGSEGQADAAPLEETQLPEEAPYGEDAREEQAVMPQNPMDPSQTRMDDAVLSPNGAPGKMRYGYILVQAAASGSSLPISFARVVITRQTEEGTELIGSFLTDENGKTEPVRVPAPPRELSEQPGRAIPYSTYNVYVSHVDYASANSIDVQVFEGIVSILPVEMLPIPEYVDPARAVENFVIPENPLVNSYLSQTAETSASEERGVD